MEKDNNISRQEALKRMGVLMGGLVLTPAALSILQSCSSESGVEWEPVLFTGEQARVVTVTAGTIMPTGENPGAVKLGVPKFIEEMVNKVYKDKDQKRFVEGLDAYSALAQKKYGKSLAECTDEQQFAFVSQQNRMMVEADQKQDENTRYFFENIKRLTLVGYFNTKVGATQVLQHQAVPGSYKGCIPLEEAGNGKTWAV